MSVDGELRQRSMALLAEVACIQLAIPGHFLDGEAQAGAVPQQDVRTLSPFPNLLRVLGVDWAAVEAVANAREPGSTFNTDELQRLRAQGFELLAGFGAQTLTVESGDVRTLRSETVQEPAGRGIESITRVLFDSPASTGADLLAMLRLVKDGAGPAVELALCHRSWIADRGLAVTLQRTATDWLDRLQQIGQFAVPVVVGHNLLDQQLVTASEVNRAFQATEALVSAVSNAWAIGEHCRVGRGESRSANKSGPIKQVTQQVLGALFTEFGYDEFRRLLTPFVEISTAQEIDFKSELQNYVQREYGVRPQYDLVGTEGPDHNKTHRVRVHVGKRMVGEGSGTTRKLAEHAAAADLIRTHEIEIGHAVPRPRTASAHGAIPANLPFRSLLTQLEIPEGREYLLAAAMRHISYSEELGQRSLASNGGLAVLGGMLQQLLYRLLLVETLPLLDDVATGSRLANWVSVLSSETMVARAFDTLGLGPLLMLGVGQSKSGATDAIRANAVQAVLASWFMASLRQPLVPSERNPLGRWLRSDVREVLSQPELIPDPKGRLQEILQCFGAKVEYPGSSSGPDHAVRWTVQAAVSEGAQSRRILSGVKEGRNKEAAERLAALQAIAVVERACAIAWSDAEVNRDAEQWVFRTALASLVRSQKYDAMLRCDFWGLRMLRRRHWQEFTRWVTDRVRAPRGELDLGASNEAALLEYFRRAGERDGGSVTHLRRRSSVLMDQLAGLLERSAPKLEVYRCVVESIALGNALAEVAHTGWLATPDLIRSFDSVIRKYECDEQWRVSLLDVDDRSIVLGCSTIVASIDGFLSVARDLFPDAGGAIAVSLAVEGGDLCVGVRLQLGVSTAEVDAVEDAFVLWWQTIGSFPACWTLSLERSLATLRVCRLVDTSEYHLAAKSIYSYVLRGGAHADTNAAGDVQWVASVARACAATLQGARSGDVSSRASIHKTGMIHDATDAAVVMMSPVVGDASSGSLPSIASQPSGVVETRDSLLDDVRQILRQALMIELVESERGSGPSNARSEADSVVLLATKGPPYRALLETVGFDLGVADGSDLTVDPLQSSTSDVLRQMAEANKQRGFEALRRLASRHRATGSLQKDLAALKVETAPLEAPHRERATSDPSKVRERGPRDISSPAGSSRVKLQLARLRERFFREDRRRDDGVLVEDNDIGAPPLEPAWLEMRETSAGGLQIVTPALRWLPPFVRTLAVNAGESTISVLAVNLRSKPWRISVPPSCEPYTWTSGKFDEELAPDLARLSTGGLSAERACAFRLNAEGVGELIATNVVSPGRRYRIVVPPALGTVALPEQLTDLGGGWRVWEVSLPDVASALLRSALESLGLVVGAVEIEVEWAATTPREVRENVRGQRFACYCLGDIPVIRITTPGLEPRSDVVVFLSGTDLAISVSLETGNEWFLAIEGLTLGTYAVQAITAGSDASAGRLLFAVDSAAATSPCAVARALLGGTQFELAEEHTTCCDLRTVVASSLELQIPPFWPVELRWRGLRIARPQVQAGDFLGRLPSEAMSPLLASWSEERAGDLVIDAGELGRLTLQHDSLVSDDEIGAMVVELLQERRGAVDGLGNDYSALRAVWFEPLTRILGYQLAEFPQSDSRSVVPGLAVWRLDSVARDGDGALSWLTTPLIVCPRNSDLSVRGPNTPRGFAAAVSRRHHAPRVLISDGLRWAVAEPGRAAGWWTEDLAAWSASPDPTAVRAFVRACGG